MLKSLLSYRRGRKILLDLMPSSIEAITINCGDHVVTANPHEFIGRRCFVLGQFERAETLDVLERVFALRPFSKDCRTIVEIGANIGTQTLYFLLDGRASHVVAIEPDPANLRLLKRNISDNYFDDKVTIIGEGVAQTEGELVLHRTAKNSGAASFKPVFSAASSVAVKTRPVKAILDELDLKAGSISFFWMDIEGFEPEVFPTLVPYLLEGVPVYLEFSPRFYGVPGTLQFIEQIEAVYASFDLRTATGWQSKSISELKHLNRQANVLLHKLKR